MAKKNKEYTEEQLKEIKLLKANYEMYQKTIEEAKVRGNDDAIRRIKNAMEDVETRLSSMEGEADHKFIDAEIVSPTPVVDESIDYGKSIDEILEERKKESEKIMRDDEETATRSDDAKYEYGKEVVNITEQMYNNVDTTAQGDVVPLPSNGECYKGKLNRVPVAYLTAYDENIITSPNLYRDGLIIEYLLKNKVLNKDINVENLVTGDVDAIILFLRATSYGVDYPISVNDPKTGENFETTVDLSKIKYKEFKLKGDENGHFDYKTSNGIEVKFKYLTRKEENDLRILARYESEGVAAEELRNAGKLINNMLLNDKILDGGDKASILETCRKIEAWAKRIEEVKPNKFNKMITNRMEMQIVAINGNYDKDYVRKMIYSMPAKEALDLRKYILENEPGVDFEVEIQRPKSLGGGSFKTFLEWNDTIFFNIA